MGPLARRPILAGAGGIAMWFGTACGTMGTRPVAPIGGAARAAEDWDRATPPVVAPPGAVTLPAVQRHRLSNGLTVLIVEKRRLLVVDARVVIRAGAAEDPPELSGLASLTAATLEEGTATRSALEIADELDFLGASVDAAATWDATAIAMHVLAPRLEPALELLADLVIRPTFPEDGFHRKKAERLTSLLQERDEPRAVAARVFAERVYGPEHPYGRQAVGSRDTVDRIGRDALADFHARHYRPGNAFLVIVGDVDAATLLPVLERSFQGWAPGPVAASPPPDAPTAAPTAIHVVNRPGAPQSEIRAGLVGIPRASPDYIPAVVLNTVLGGAFTSRLNLRLRQEMGLTYGVGSRFHFRLGPGPFVIATAVATDATDTAVAVIRDEIRRLRDEPVPEHELERARRYVALGLPRRLETTAQITALVAETELYGLGDDYYADFVDRVLAVDADEVRRAARALLDPERLTVVVVGDVARVEAPLSRLGLGPVHLHEVP